MTAAPTIDRPFLFLRHGETAWNLEGRCQGQLDVDLNAAGYAQARAAAETLADIPIARIVASPLRRARYTADAVARDRDLPLVTDPDLRECHLGAHQGQPHGPWLGAYWRGEHHPPAGERFEDFVERVWAAMARAVALGPNTLIVAHGGLWRAAREKVRVSPAFRMPNAVPIRVTPGPDGWSAEPLRPIPEAYMLAPDAPAPA